jgi:hypothetical protein
LKFLHCGIGRLQIFKYNLRKCINPCQVNIKIKKKSRFAFEITSEMWNLRPNILNHEINSILIVTRVYFCKFFSS